MDAGTSLAVQWLRLHASNAGGEGSTPGQGTKIPHATWRGQILKKIILDFPGSPVVKTLRFHCRVQVQSLVGEVPHATWYGKKKKKKKLWMQQKQKEIYSNKCTF